MHLTRRYQRSWFALALVGLLYSSGAAMAQTETQTQSAIAVVTAQEAYVRSGGAQTYYPVSKAKQGDLVRVVGEKFGWAKVEAAGPVFRDLYAFIKYARTDTSRFRMAASGQSGLTLGLTDIIAPNLLSGNSPSASWKRIDILQPDVEVPVLETIQTERDTFHRIPVPSTATLWINMNDLRAANAQETARFAQLLAGAPLEDEIPAANAPVTIANSGGNAQATGQDTTATHEQPAPAVDNPAVVEMGNQGQPIDAAAPTGTQPAVDAATTTSAIPAQPAEATEAKARFDKLERSLEKLRTEDIATAEVTPLRELFLALAEDVREEDGNVALFAEARAEQLQIWTDLQAKKHKINELQLRAARNTEHANATRTALASSADYTAVGRLAVSTIYDGKGLPQLLRLQDPATGRTVAYLVPNDEFNMFGLLDQLIGVVGVKQYDEGLRLNLITKIERVDLLARHAGE